MLFPTSSSIAGDLHLVFAFGKDLETGFAIWTCGNLVHVCQGQPEGEAMGKACLACLNVEMHWIQWLHHLQVDIK